MTINDTINKAISDSNSKIPNLTRTIAYASQDAYVSAMNNIYKQVGTGKVDYNTALSKTINDLTKNGVTIKSETSGRKDRIEVAVRRGLFGSLHQTANDISKRVGEEIDYNCVFIGHSSTCRPSHNVIDDVIMSKEEFKKYEHLTEEYGCNHIVNYDWLEEFENSNIKKKYGDEHMNYNECKKNYEIQQKARYYERVIRAKKNAIESGDTSDKLKKELQLARIKYRIFCNSNNLKMSYNRVITPTPKVSNKLLFNDNIITQDFKDKDNKVETMIIYDIRTKNKIYTTTNNKRNMVGDLKSLIIFEKSKPNSLVTAHNHPTNTSFSKQDIITFNRFKSIDSLFVETDEYTYYLTKNNVNKIKNKDLNKILTDIRNMYYNKYGKTKEAIHLVNIEICKRIGWKYGRIRKK
ncbi:MAG: hypothetical protein HFJ12_01545 [Bacilli bacterium]|nr:hypothetical protein [Bacilli bacterium]